MKLYHVSEEPDIKVFHSRPSPQSFNSINGEVVFAVSDKMLHNYLLPRDCPRVTYYCKADSSSADIERFFGNSRSQFILNTEESWKEKISKAVLYLYELPQESFNVLDEGAGYYISYESITPLNIIKIENVFEELNKRDTEIRFHHTINQLAAEIADSTLQFSIIRLRNAL